MCLAARTDADLPRIARKPRMFTIPLEREEKLMS